MADSGRTPNELCEFGELVAVLANPATSYWFRDAITASLERDPFDAERDAIALAALLTRRVDELVVRMVMTHDVGSDETTTRYAIGPAAAGTVLRDWMTEMCGPVSPTATPASG